MDSITHTVLGACTGELIAGKKIGKKAMVIGAIVNNLPDIDMLANFWNTPAAALLTHRGITHSILFAVLATPLLIFLGRRYVKTEVLTYKEWILLIAHGLFLHILMDACTTYGTGWFEPFSSYRVSFNTLFILDPVFMLPLLIGAITLWILKKNLHTTRKIVTSAALSLSLFYLVVTVCIKLNINRTIEDELQRQKITYSHYIGSPTPMNNLLWYVLVKDRELYHVGYYSVLDSTKKISFENIYQNDSLLLPYAGNKEVQYLKRFSKQLYTVKPLANGVQFCDLRFGLTAVHGLSEAPPVFNFDILPASGDPQNKVLVKQSEFKKFDADELRALFDRVKGE